MGPFGRFQIMIISPQNPHSLSLGSFRKMGARLNRQQIMHSLPLASFGRFQMMIIGPQNPQSLSLVSFGASEF